MISPQDLSAACSCYATAAEMVNTVKSEKCSAKEEFQNIRAVKDLCLGNFSVCKKAEDASVGLIHTW